MKGEAAKKPARMRRNVIVEECCAANDVCASAEGCDEHSDAAEQLTNDNKVSGLTRRIIASQWSAAGGELGSKSATVLPEAQVPTVRDISVCMTAHTEK